MARLSITLENYYIPISNQFPSTPLATALFQLLLYFPHLGLHIYEITQKFSSILSLLFGMIL